MSTLTKLVFSILPPIPSERVEVYPGDNVAIMKATNVFQGPFSIDNYVFMMPCLETIPFTIDNKVFNVHPNMILPVEPGWLMQTPENRDVQAYVVIVIKKDFFKNICQTIYGRANVTFARDKYIAGEGILRLINLFMLECKSLQPGCELIMESLSIQLAVSILRSMNENMLIDLNGQICNEGDCISKAINFLIENYDKEYSFEEIARIANFSPYHFIRRFKAETGKTPYEYLVDIKIKKAKELLRTNKFTITEVSLLSGFNSLNHFSTTFKKKHGISPNDYRKGLVW
ncbi:MAG: hypothetical protein K0R09_1510 [Clostridiales bacterium]|nr:hypothetical protein [Clostridiales bacterium]